jgi:molecular chaperone DnaJ
MDLFVEVPISYTQAALGAFLEIPTLDGPDKLTISPGTQSGQVFRLEKRGMPDPRSGRRGDLLVQTYVEVPKRLDHQEEELLRKLAEHENRNVSPKRSSFVSKLKEIFTPAE